MEFVPPEQVEVGLQHHASALICYIYIFLGYNGPEDKTGKGIKYVKGGCVGMPSPVNRVNIL